MDEDAAQKSLQGTSVVVTRPREQAGLLARQLINLGATPKVFPCIDIEAVDCTSALAALPIDLGQVDQCIFVSRNAVQHGFAQIPQLHRLAMDQALFASTGLATAQSLHEYGVTRVISPKQDFDSSSLLRLAPMHDVHGKSILIVKGIGGRTELMETLQKRGAKVFTLDVYRRCLPSQINLETLQPAPDCILFSSSESVENMLKIIPTDQHPIVLRSQTIVGHARIGAKVTSLGFEKLPIIAANPADQAMLAALIGWANRTENHNEQSGRNGTK